MRNPEINVMLQDGKVQEAAEELRRQLNGRGEVLSGARAAPVMAERECLSPVSDAPLQDKTLNSTLPATDFILKSDKSMGNTAFCPYYIIYIDIFRKGSKLVFPSYGPSYTSIFETRANRHIPLDPPQKIAKWPVEEILRFSDILNIVTDVGDGHVMARRVILTANEFGFVYNSLVARIFAVFKQSCRASLSYLTELGLIRRVSHRDLDKKSYSNLLSVARTMGESCGQDPACLLRRFKLYHINPKYLALVEKLMRPTRQERAALRSWRTKKLMPNADAAILANRRAYLERRGSRGM